MEPINTELWPDMIGFAVYSFEGVGVVIPLYDATSRPDLYEKLITGILLVVLIFYICFSELCLFVYGDLLTQPLITSNLP